MAGAGSGPGRQTAGQRAEEAAPPPGDAAASRSWRQIIRAERRRVGLTQAELAERTGIAAETIRKYERGDRLPSRDSLERILDALQVPVATRHAALQNRGFHHPDFRYPRDEARTYYFVVDELRSYVEEVPWPQFVSNELGEILVANRATQALWGIDLAAELASRSRAGANMFVAMAEPRFAAHLANWEEIVRHFVAMFKAVPASRTMLDDPGALFSEVIDAFASANPAALPALYRIWDSTPARSAKVRWMYPVVWREPGFADIRFQAVVNPASEPEVLGFNDWLPLDAAAHATLEAVLAARPNRGVLSSRGRGLDPSEPR